MDAQAIPRVRDNVRVRRFRGHLLVAVADDSLELTESAEFIFRKIDGRRTIEEIGAMLAEEYDIPLAVAREDTMQLLGELSGQLITTLG